MSNALRAALWMGGAIVSFMAMALGGRELSADLTTFQVLFFRSVVGLVIVLSIARIRRVNLVATQRRGLHIARNLAHFLGQFGWFFAIAAIPLAEVFAMEFTIPVWASATENAGTSSAHYTARESSISWGKRLQGV